jgi:hypothetical protein
VVGRRLVILVAVLMGLTALAASVAPPPETTRRGAASPTATAPPPPPPPVTETRRVVATLDVARGHDRVTVHQGDTLALSVAADEVGSVEIEGLGLVEAVDPASPARFELAADTTGHYPVQLAETGRDLGELVVNPRR